MSAAMFAKMKELEARVKALEERNKAQDNPVLAPVKTLKLPEKKTA
jgi:hypothetical protein